MKVARVRSWLGYVTWEPVASRVREEPKWKPHEGQSTDAGHRGGWACSSVEVPVMGMERRGPITRFRRRVNPAMGRNSAGKRRQSLRFDVKSTQRWGGTWRGDVALAGALLHEGSVWSNGPLHVRIAVSCARRPIRRLAFGPCATTHS